MPFSVVFVEILFVIYPRLIFFYLHIFIFCFFVVGSSLYWSIIHIKSLFAKMAWAHVLKFKCVCFSFMRSLIVDACKISAISSIDFSFSCSYLSFFHFSLHIYYDFLYFQHFFFVPCYICLCIFFVCHYNNSVLSVKKHWTRKSNHFC